MKLIGITGLAKHGKDTIADYLVNQYAFMKYSFADPIKEMVNLLVQPFGVRVTDPYWINNKEEVIPGLGRSLRFLYQTLGTEWGRELVNPDLWVMCAVAQYEELVKEHNEHQLVFGGLVVPDVRFENEAEFLRKAGGKIYKVERIGVEAVRTHVSENGLDHEFIDDVIFNNGTLTDLYEQVEDKMLD